MRDYSDAEEFLVGMPSDARAVDVYVYEDEYWGPTLSASFSFQVSILIGLKIKQAKRR
ncbi:hypothetical protein HAALTHF_05200n [Vreelandella aquamarina]|nr:hypothetical protein HAALTHF_05200n [Halomonas axialensis]